VDGSETSTSRRDDWEPFRLAGHSLVDGVADHLAALPSRPVWQPLPDEIRRGICDLPLPDRLGVFRVADFPQRAGSGV
jgi:hypothetical protein